MEDLNLFYIQKQNENKNKKTLFCSFCGESLPQNIASYSETLLCDSCKNLDYIEQKETKKQYVVEQDSLVCIAMVGVSIGIGRNNGRTSI